MLFPDNARFGFALTDLAEALRSIPHRQLPAVARLGSNLELSARLVQAKTSQIATLRTQYLGLRFPTVAL